MIICDSSSLILLAKIDRIDTLADLYGKVLIPDAVYEEAIVKGKEGRYSDAFLLEKQIGKLIIVKELDKNHKAMAESLQTVIGKGESEAILLCKQEKQKILLTDDLDSARIAATRGITSRTTLGLLYESLKKGIIDLKGYEASIKEFSKSAWVSGDVVAEYLQAGYNFKGDKK